MKIKMFTYVCYKLCKSCDVSWIFHKTGLHKTFSAHKLFRYNKCKTLNPCNFIEELRKQILMGRKDRNKMEKEILNVHMPFHGCCWGINIRNSSFQAVNGYFILYAKHR